MFVILSAWWRTLWWRIVGNSLRLKCAMILHMTPRKGREKARKDENRCKRGVNSLDEEGVANSLHVRFNLAVPVSLDSRNLATAHHDECLSCTKRETSRMIIELQNPEKARWKYPEKFGRKFSPLTLAVKRHSKVKLTCEVRVDPRNEVCRCRKCLK